MSATATEPARLASTITAVVGASIILAVAFGLNLTEEQTVAITGFVAIVAPIVAAEVIRRKVTPTSQVGAQIGKDGELVAGPAVGVPVETNVPVQVQAAPVKPKPLPWP